MRALPFRCPHEVERCSMPISLRSMGASKKTGQNRPCDPVSQTRRFATSLIIRNGRGGSERRSMKASTIAGAWRQGREKQCHFSPSGIFASLPPRERPWEKNSGEKEAASVRTGHALADASSLRVARLSATVLHLEMQST